MFRSLQQKLVLAFMLISIVGALLALVFSRWLVMREFSQMVIDRSQNQFVEYVTEYYQAHGTWTGVALYLRESRQFFFQQKQVFSRGQDQDLPDFLFTLVDQEGVVVVPGGPYRRSDTVPKREIDRGVPVIVDGQVVGVVIATGNPPALEPREERYLTRANRVLYLSAIVAATAALILGVFLTRSLVDPLRELTVAIRKMAHGQLGQQVSVRSQDEIGELAASFNQMSTDLARLNQQRRQMTADIAHDLRTPLTVLSGYVEALQEGVLQPTPERLDTMNAEIQSLIRLVEDLRTLSLADAGELVLNIQSVNPQSLLERAAAAFSQRAEEKSITLQIAVPPQLPLIAVDPERMHQVLGNLIANALRHTPAEGLISLRCAVTPALTPESKKLAANQFLQIAVADTGQGIPAEALPHLFDRFYRVDAARQGNGESGLGLAIAKSIVEAHGGSISASSALGQGATFTISLPLADTASARQ